MEIPVRKQRKKNAGTQFDYSVRTPTSGIVLPRFKVSLPSQHKVLRTYSDRLIRAVAPFDNGD